MKDQGIGAAVRRKEDRRFLTGRGRYVDDVRKPGELWAQMVRSPLAHARIRKIDAGAARAAAGVVAVFTGADMLADGVGSLPCGWLIHSADGKPMAEPPHIPISPERARHVGDVVAVVIAETRVQAREASALLRIDWQELPPVVSCADATAPDAPLVWDDVPGNTCYAWEIGDRSATDAAFARAAHVVALDLVNNRLIPNALEPRAAIGEFDPASGQYTLTTSSQNPHVIRLLMGAFVLKIPEHKLRVVSPDVGGGFGSKIFHYAEEAIVTWAAGKLARPVRWTAERSESFTSDAHGRDHVSRAELALDEQGHFLGLRVRTVANLGAYLSTFGSSVPTYLYGTLLAGPYRTPAIHCEVRAVFTNTTPVDAYRGAGRPEATYLLERLVDTAARQLGIDRVELRRRNLIPKDAFPYQTPVALQYDVGDYAATLELALAASDWAGFETRRAEAKRRGRLRGIGISTYVEACGLAPSRLAGQLGARAGLYESAAVRVHPTGSVTIFTGSHSHGQGHETAFAQIASDRLGVELDAIEVVHGDTALVPFGMGTYGSRSLAVGGAALSKALDKIVAKGRRIAAHMLEAGEVDIELRGGRFAVRGSDASVGLSEVAFAAYVPHDYPHEELEPGLEESAFYDPKNFTFPAGCHVVEVEIDPETGTVEVARVSVADDVGNVINPMLVEGQIHGGLAQGIGQALLEGAAYDERGQLLTSSYMQYAMPRASDLPFFEVGHHVTPCTHNPLGAKGVGEVGAIGVPPAVIGAVLDALAPAGVKDIEMPATPERVWRALRAARQG